MRYLLLFLTLGSFFVKAQNNESNVDCFKLDYIKKTDSTIINNKIDTYSSNGTENWRPPVFLFKSFYFMKQDTIYDYHVYGKNNNIDSIELSEIITRILGEKNIWEFSDSFCYYECKFKKKRDSEWFKSNNPIYFNAEAEYKLVYRKQYRHDGTKAEIVRIYPLHIKRKSIKIKKKL